MGLNGLKNNAPKAIRLSFPGMFQGRWELVWLWSLVEAESKELLFKPNQGDKMAQEKGKGKSPCVKTWNWADPLNHGQEWREEIVSDISEM